MEASPPLLQVSVSYGQSLAPFFSHPFTRQTGVLERGPGIALQAMHEFEETLGGGDEHGSLACYSPWGYKELDTTELLN